MSVSSFYYRRSNPEDGLQASLDSHREEVLSWVDQGPLRLVAAALADLQGSGKAGDLQYKLENQVLGSAGVKWNNWWKKVQPSLKESAHFRIAKPNTYALAPGVRAENIPVEPLVVKARPKERSGARPTWNQWFKSKRWPLPDKESAPGAKPPDKIIADIGRCDSETIERLVPRTVACAEEFLTRPTDNRSGGTEVAGTPAGKLKPLRRAPGDRIRHRNGPAKVGDPVPAVAYPPKGWQPIPLGGECQTRYRKPRLVESIGFRNLGCLP